MVFLSELTQSFISRIVSITYFSTPHLTSSFLDPTPFIPMSLEATQQIFALFRSCAFSLHSFQWNAIIMTVWSGTCGSLSEPFQCKWTRVGHTGSRCHLRAAVHAGFRGSLRSAVHTGSGSRALSASRLTPAPCLPSPALAPGALSPPRPAPVPRAPSLSWPALVLPVPSPFRSVSVPRAASRSRPALVPPVPSRWLSCPVPVALVPPVPSRWL